MNIATLISGGVDSAVAVHLLREQGHRPDLFYIRIGMDTDDGLSCTAEEDIELATATARKYGLKLEIIDLHQEYWERVVSYTLDKVRRGLTPNPDVMCNKLIKFGCFDEKAGHAYDKIATGHYARVRQTDNGVELLRGLDGSKDQSYFLHRLNQKQLEKAIFPVGELPKTKVREIARMLDLSVAGKKDSTGICFIGERPFREFLSRYLPTHPGPIRTDTGKIVGEHVGLSFYTLGQRKGIGVGGSREGTGEPWFVARKDLATNTLWIVQGHEHPWLNTHTLKAVRTSWVSGHAPEPGTPVTVKTRYRAPDGACEVASVDSESIDLSFPVPQWAATPGQSAVLYQGEVCLGGGFIDTIDNADIPKLKKA